MKLNTGVCACHTFEAEIWLEVIFLDANFFGVLLNLLRISEIQIYDSRDLITFGTNLFMICPHHPTVYKTQSDIKFDPYSAESSDTEQKNNEALFSLQARHCYSGLFG